MKILHVGLCVDGKNEGLPFALKKASTKYVELNPGLSDVNNRIIKEAQSGFDLAFFQVQAAGIIHPLTFSKLNDMGIFTLNWTGDIRGTTDDWFFKTNAKLTCFSNMRDVNNMKSQGFNADFLQIGIDPKVYNRHNLDMKGYDVVYMGNNYRNQFPLGQQRFNLVTMLWARYRHRFGLYGNGWNLSNPENNADQKTQSIIYNNSKIGINYSQFDEERYTSDRLFRILGSGCFCLSHHYRGIDNDFEVGVHLDTFRNLPELQNKIDFYTKNEDKRKEIAENGYKLCHEKHTYDSMVKDIKDLHKKYEWVML
jgi:hypothetical protein